MKRLFLFFVYLVFLSSCLDAGEKVAAGGDLVELDYVGRLEDGSVFDTTLGSIAADELTVKAPTFAYRRKYEPFKFRINSNEVIRGFEKNILGMKEGEEREFWVEPQEGYGEWKSELAKSYPRSAAFDTYELISMDAINLKQEEIQINATFLWIKCTICGYWKARIAAIDWKNSTVVIENIAKNATINREFGVMRIIAGEKITVWIDPILNAEIKMKIGTARVSEMNETDFVLDSNHPFAGKRLKFYVRINSIEGADNVDEQK